MKCVISTTPKFDKPLITFINHDVKIDYRIAGNFRGLTSSWFKFRGSASGGHTLQNIKLVLTTPLN